jgi:hypothetical protein
LAHDSFGVKDLSVLYFPLRPTTPLSEGKPRWRASGKNQYHVRPLKAPSGPKIDWKTPRPHGAMGRRSYASNRANAAQETHSAHRQLKPRSPKTQEVARRSVFSLPASTLVLTRVTHALAAGTVRLTAAEPS